MPNATGQSIANSAYHSMDRDDLLRALEMFAKNWLAHDGCWFLAAEERLGMDTAIELDTEAWRRFATTEANRIMATFHLPQAGGLQALETALGLQAIQPDQCPASGMVGRRQAPALLYGRLPGTGSAPTQRARRFSLQACGHGRVRNFRPHHRLPHPDPLPSLPA